MANAAVARDVAGVYDLKAKPAPGSGEKVAGALATAYEALGVRASDVGTYRAP